VRPPEVKKGANHSAVNDGAKTVKHENENVKHTWKVDELGNKICESSSNLEREHFEAVTPFLIMLNFLKLTFFSVLIGIIFGVIPTWLTKNWRFLSHSAIIETSLMLCFALSSYYVSELADMSGIVTLLSCALIMSHYTWYNLSP